MHDDDVKRYQVNWVSIDSLHEDKSNPNTMDEREFNALVREISIHGIIQPIIARPCSCSLIQGEHRCIVGGEHRWRAARHLKMREVPCIDLEIDEVQARILMVNLNSIHGRVIPMKLANLILDLNRNLPMDEIRSRLYLDRDYLRSLAASNALTELHGRLKGKVTNVDPAGMDGRDTGSKRASGHARKDDPRVGVRVLSVTLSREQYDDVIHVLDDIASRHGCTRGDALVILCRMHSAQ